MRNSVVENWSRGERRLPGIDCIAYPDGRVTILNSYSLYDPNTNEAELFSRPLCDTTIASIEQYDAAYWTQVDEWTRIDYQGRTILGGDGSMGNEGFIAHIDTDCNLLWAMFFTHTNPIKRLQIQGQTLIAVNEHDELQITVNLDALTDIKITRIEQRE